MKGTFLPSINFSFIFVCIYMSISSYINSTGYIDNAFSVVWFFVGAINVKAFYLFSKDKRYINAD